MDVGYSPSGGSIGFFVWRTKAKCHFKNYVINTILSNSSLGKMSNTDTIPCTVILCFLTFCPRCIVLTLIWNSGHILSIYWMYTTAQNIAIGQLAMQQLHIYTAHFDFTTAQIVINCTLKYAPLELYILIGL